MPGEERFVEGQRVTIQEVLKFFGITIFDDANLLALYKIDQMLMLSFQEEPSPGSLTFEIEGNFPRLSEAEKLFWFQLFEQLGLSVRGDVEENTVILDR